MRGANGIVPDKQLFLLAVFWLSVFLSYIFPTITLILSPFFTFFLHKLDTRIFKL